MLFIQIASLFSPWDAATGLLYLNLSPPPRKGFDCHDSVILSQPLGHAKVLCIAADT